METQNTPQQAPQSTPQQQNTQGTPQQVPQTKKMSPWVWVLGGCLIICILIVIAVGLLGWWGAQKIKSEYDKQAPNMQKMIDDAQREQKEWEEMSNDIQQDLSDIESQIPQDIPRPY